MQTSHSNFPLSQVGVSQPNISLPQKTEQMRAASSERWEKGRSPVNRSATGSRGATSVRTEWSLHCLGATSVGVAGPFFPIHQPLTPANSAPPCSWRSCVYITKRREEWGLRMFSSCTWVPMREFRAYFSSCCIWAPMREFGADLWCLKQWSVIYVWVVWFGGVEGYYFQM